MDTRSLIKFGRTSYVVTLPQSWIKKEGLGKGDPIHFEDNGSGLFISSSSKTKKDQNKKIEIDVTDKDLFRIRRELVAYYINGYDVIRIIGKDLMNKSKDIRDIMHSLVSLEVLEQTATRMTAKVFLSSKNIFIPQLIRKLDILNRNMMEDMTAKSVDYNDILQRDNDVDRVTFLLLRIIKTNLQDNSSARIANLSNNKLLDYWNVAYALEAIADEVRKLSFVFKDLSKNKAAFKNIIGLYSYLVKAYLKAMDAYYAHDVESAYKTSSIKIEVIQRCAELYNRYWDKKGAVIALERIKDLAFLIHGMGRRVYS